MITEKIDSFFPGIYNLNKFIGLYFKEAVSAPFERKEIISHCYNIGNKSLPLATLTAFITWMIFTKQSRPSLATFGPAIGCHL